MKIFLFLLLTGCQTSGSERLQAVVNKLTMRLNLVEQKLGEVEADVELLKTAPKAGK